MALRRYFAPIRGNGQRLENSQARTELVRTRNRTQALPQRDVAVVGRRAAWIAVAIDIAQGERDDGRSRIDRALEQGGMEGQHAVASRRRALGKYRDVDTGLQVIDHRLARALRGGARTAFEKDRLGIRA